MLNRKRHIDIEKIDLNDIGDLTNKITGKMTSITQKAIDDANKILNIYGMEASMQIAIKQINAIK